MNFVLKEYGYIYIRQLMKCSRCRKTNDPIYFLRISTRDGELREFKNCNKCFDYVYKFNKNNRDTINKKKMTKVECQCGCHITKSNISTHRKSKKHQRLIEAKQAKQ